MASKEGRTLPIWDSYVFRDWRHRKWNDTEKMGDNLLLYGKSDRANASFWRWEWHNWALPSRKCEDAWRQRIGFGFRCVVGSNFFEVHAHCMCLAPMPTGFLPTTTAMWQYAQVSIWFIVAITPTRTLVQVFFGSILPVLILSINNDAMDSLDLYYCLLILRPLYANLLIRQNIRRMFISHLSSSSKTQMGIMLILDLNDLSMTKPDPGSSKDMLYANVPP